MSMHKSTECIDIRDAFFDSLYDIAVADPDVIFLTADMSAFSLQKFKRDLPDRYFNVGVAEQNLIGVAAGLALSGKKVFVYAIAPFVTQRCFEQIKVDLCAMNLPVTIIGTGPGICYASDGPTHHAVEDIGIMRCLPNMTIYNPSDPVGAAEAARLGLESDGPVYVRLDKGAQNVLHTDPASLNEGVVLLRLGDDLLILATGLMIHRALELSEELSKQGIEAAVAEAYRIKPFNEDRFFDLAVQIGRVVTLEEHSKIGGLGSVAAEALADRERKVPLLRLALPDAYQTEYGGRDWMLECAGINQDQILRRIMDWIRKSIFPNFIGPEDFARFFGIKRPDLPLSCIKLIEEYDFSYRFLQGEERDIVLRDVIHRIFVENMNVAGKEKQPLWEKGWGENLKCYLDGGQDPRDLIPKYYRPDQVMRIDRKYARAADPGFEYNFFTVLRQWLFETYLQQAYTVYEFGCGPGHNLLHLAQLYPHREIHGLDWSQEAVNILKILGETNNITGHLFDMFHPDTELAVKPNSAFITFGALEQLGQNYQAFLDFLVEAKPLICVHVEPFYELFDPDNLLDYLAIAYPHKRNHLGDYIASLRKKEAEEKVHVQTVNRMLFGSLYEEGWSIVVWGLKKYD